MNGSGKGEREAKIALCHEKEGIIVQGMAGRKKGPAFPILKKMRVGKNEKKVFIRFRGRKEDRAKGDKRKKLGPETVCGKTCKRMEKKKYLIILTPLLLITKKKEKSCFSEGEGEEGVTVLYPHKKGGVT